MGMKLTLHNQMILQFISKCTYSLSDRTSPEEQCRTRRLKRYHHNNKPEGNNINISF